MSRIDHHRPLYPEPRGEFKRSYHLEMVADYHRTRAIVRALTQSLQGISKDTVFCELGCGTGIFSIYAAKELGCRKVFAVELDPKMVGVAQKNIDDNGVSDRVTLIKGDAREITLPEKADIIFCEMMSIWCIEEPQIPVINHALQHHLKPGGVILPTRIVNLAELGYFKFKHKDIVMKASMPLFTGVPRSGIFTERRLCHTLDFTQPVSISLDCRVPFTALGSGTLNCAKLTSVVQIGPRTIFSGSDSLMPLTVVPLEEEVEVEMGQEVILEVTAHARMDLNDAIFRVTL